MADQQPGERRRFSRAFARIVVRLRWLVVVAWIAVAAFATLTLPDIKSAQTGSLGDLVASDATAIETEERSIELFEFPVLSRTVVVQRKPAGFSAVAEAEIFARGARVARGELAGLESILFALPVTDDIARGFARPVALRGATAALTYLFFPLEIGPEGQTSLARKLVADHIASPADGAVGVTGAVPARAEQVTAISEALPLVELATLILVTLAVGLHYRAPGAPLANVASIAIAYLTSVHLIGGLGQEVGISVPEEVEPVMVALLFGIVTDYAIFFISRFRGYLQEGEEPASAAERTTADLLPTIVAAAISVVAASAVLVTAQLGFFRAFGPGTALAVMVALAVVTTFLPALLAIFGRWILWPGRRIPAERGEVAPGGPLGGAREAIMRLPTTRPVPVIAATAVPLLILAFFTSGMQLGNTLISGLPEDSPPRQTLAEARKSFAPGAISPMMVLVERDGISAERDSLRTLQESLTRRKNVSAVVGPAQLRGPPVDLGAVVSPTGDAVRYLLILDVNPLGSRGVRVASSLREDLDALLSTSGLAGAEANLAGDTALAEETVSETEDDLASILPLATLAVFVVLAIFLRALVAPLYLVAASLLALGASLGLTVLVFQDALGYGELTFFVPFSGIVLLIALGSDYNVYLVGRVWAEARNHPLRKAVAVAGARASTAITVAGFVLALSFSMLAIVPLRPFRELAFLLASGLLIDALIVRSLLAPALISLVGTRSGWPGRSLAPGDGKAGPRRRLGGLPAKLRGLPGRLSPLSRSADRR